MIVSYRCRELLRGCLDSLREHAPSGAMKVIVVDNASGDGTVEMVSHDYPEVDLVASPTNLGFAAATNLGARRGTSPCLLALNPDTAVEAGTLDTLLGVLREHDRVAVAGPRLLQEDGSFDHAARRSFPTPLSALGHFTGVGRRRGASGALAAYRAPEVESGPVDAVNGAFMLMRRDAFEQLGGFDEGYWMYMEDLDLSYRLAGAGWTTWYEPNATALHVKAGTTGAVRSPKLVWAFHRGMYRFYRKHYWPQRSLPVNLAVYAGITLKLGIALVQSALRRSVARLRSRRRIESPNAGPSGGSQSPG